ncbi:MAG: hypothetical protein D6689_02185 [Deltaproteobacteria bacterium]|nr:MAG: hypothetical protein D6689_02185 [Deltaproteobacteria bacterium]
MGVLGPDVVDRLVPVLELGLGWIGFMVGYRFDVRTLDRVPRHTALIVAIESAVPFVAVAAACAVALIAFGRDPGSPAVWRDVVVLGACGAMTAPRYTLGIGDRAARLGDVDTVVGELDEIAGVVALVVLGAVFRPAGGAWALPAAGWVFVQLGAGLALGLLLYVMLRDELSAGERLAVTLGFIAFASGVAGYLFLSPIAVCFLAGWVVANLPGEHRAAVWDTFRALERPIHHLFLIVLGALWAVDDWRGWALVPVFVGARLVGKAAGRAASARAVRRRGDEPAGDRAIVAPLSVLSIALVVSVRGLYAGETISWLVTAVVGAAIVSEILVQLVAPRRDDLKREQMQQSVPGEPSEPAGRATGSAPTGGAAAVAGARDSGAGGPHAPVPAGRGAGPARTTAGDGGAPAAAAASAAPDGPATAAVASAAPDGPAAAAALDVPATDAARGATDVPANDETAAGSAAHSGEEDLR